MNKSYVVLYVNGFSKENHYVFIPEASSLNKALEIFAYELESRGNYAEPNSVEMYECTRVEWIKRVPPNQLKKPVDERHVYVRHLNISTKAYNILANHYGGHPKMLDTKLSDLLNQGLSFSTLLSFKTCGKKTAHEISNAFKSLGYTLPL